MLLHLRMPAYAYAYALVKISLRRTQSFEIRMPMFMSRPSSPGHSFMLVLPSLVRNRLSERKVGSSKKTVEDICTEFLSLN